MSTQDSEHFRATVSAGSSETLTTEVLEDATAEEVRIRFYSGTALSLEVSPFVERDSGDKIPLVQVHGAESVVGDADYWTFPVSLPLYRGDTLGVDVANTSDPTLNDGEGFSYDTQITVVVDEEGGADRPASGLLSRLFGGVLS